MGKKFILGISLISFLVLGGGIWFASSLPTKTTLEKTAGATFLADHKSADLKTIAYEKGVVTHAFPIQNTGNKPLNITNLATSCMCTKVYFTSGKEKGPQAGMKGMSSTSAWIGTLQPQEKGEIVAMFDPQFHGPQGVGAISRLVSFETNDPDHPHVELSFAGVVVR